MYTGVFGFYRIYATYMQGICQNFPLWGKGKSHPGKNRRVADKLWGLSVAYCAIRADDLFDITASSPGNKERHTSPLFHSTFVGNARKISAAIERIIPNDCPTLRDCDAR